MLVDSEMLCVCIVVAVWSGMTAVCLRQLIEIDRGDPSWVNRFVGILVCFGWPLVWIIHQITNPHERFMVTFRKALKD